VALDLAGAAVTSADPGLRSIWRRGPRSDGGRGLAALGLVAAWLRPGCARPGGATAVRM